MKPYVRLWEYLAEFFVELEMFQTRVVEKTKIHILWSVTFSRKLCLCDVMWKNMVQPDKAQLHYGTCVFRAG